MTLDELIAVASTDYPEVGEYHRHPEENHGDTLAKFVAIELADTFDPTATDEDQREEAQQVMQSAIDDLQKVIDAL